MPLVIFYCVVIRVSFQQFFYNQQAYRDNLLRLSSSHVLSATKDGPKFFVLNSLTFVFMHIPVRIIIVPYLRL